MLDRHPLGVKGVPNGPLRLVRWARLSAAVAVLAGIGLLIDGRLWRGRVPGPADVEFAFTFDRSKKYVNGEFDWVASFTYADKAQLAKRGAVEATWNRQKDLGTRTFVLLIVGAALLAASAALLRRAPRSLSLVGALGGSVLAYALLAFSAGSSDLFAALGGAQSLGSPTWQSHLSLALALVSAATLATACVFGWRARARHAAPATAVSAIPTPTAPSPPTPPGSALPAGPGTKSSTRRLLVVVGALLLAVVAILLLTKRQDLWVMSREDYSARLDDLVGKTGMAVIDDIGQPRSVQLLGNADEVNSVRLWWRVSDGSIELVFDLKNRNIGERLRAEVREGPDVVLPDWALAAIRLDRWRRSTR